MLGLFVAVVSMIPLTMVSMSLIVVILTLNIIHKMIEENPNIEGSMNRVG
jgi:hypothetical protein